MVFAARWQRHTDLLKWSFRNCRSWNSGGYEKLDFGEKNRQNLYEMEQRHI